MGREFSLESSEHQNGYFTVALTEGLSGMQNADANSDGLIYFTELDTYVSDRVKELTERQAAPRDLQARHDPAVSADAEKVGERERERTQDRLTPLSSSASPYPFSSEPRHPDP